MDLDDFRARIKAEPKVQQYLAERQDQQIEDTLNAIDPDIEITRPVITAAEVKTLILPTDRKALQEIERSELLTWQAIPNVNFANDASLADLFAGTDTGQALADYATRPGSIMESWYGAGERANIRDIGAAFAEEATLAQVAAEPAQKAAELADYQAQFNAEADPDKREEFLKHIDDLFAAVERATKVAAAVEKNGLDVLKLDVAEIAELAAAVDAEVGEVIPNGN